MVIVVVGGKIQRIIMTSFFIILLAFCFYRYTAILADKNHQSGIPVHETNELNGNAAAVFLVSSDDQKNIEIFDIGKGSVTKAVPVNDTALTEAKKFLKGITGVYLKANALPEKGCIVKIPFEPEIKVKNRWLNDYGILYIDKMFIIFPEEGTPYLFILDNKERPYLFNFEGDTDKLMKNLKFEAD